METNFFRQFADMDIESKVMLTIAKVTDTDMVVSIVVDSKACGDTAKNLIPPLVINRSIEELDRLFFTAIREPVKKTSSLLVEMESHLKKLERAKKQSRMEQDKKGRETLVKDDPDSRYREAMAKVDELDRMGKPRDAWMKLPDPAKYPEHAEAILKRRTELSNQFAPDLFGTAMPTVAPKPPQEKKGETRHHYPEYVADDAEEANAWNEENETEY